MPKKVGPCRGALPRWHFNPITKKCENFIFGGCKENRNNFLSLEECANACHTVLGTLLFITSSYVHFLDKVQIYRLSPADTGQ